MDKKKYPTRMHEVLGVEPGERFRLKSDPHGNEWFVSENGMMIMDCEDGVARSGVHNVFSAINHGITRRPRLSEEQVKQLKALHKAFGVRYAHNPENADCMVVFSIKPLTVEERMEWDGTVVVNDCAAGAGLRKLFTQKGQVVDIVQALRDAGVEVDDGRVD